MLTLAQFIAERVHNLDGGDHRLSPHLDAMHHILHTSYKSVPGGYGGHGSGTSEEHAAIHDDLTHPNHQVKVHTKDGKPTAVLVFKRHSGRKLIALGHNGSEHGRTSLHKTMQAAVKHKTNMWGELSGGAQHIAKKAGWSTIHSKHAAEIVGKKILSHSANGATYQRLIGGHAHEKSLMGNPTSKTTLDKHQE